ncbi:MAG: DUF177 domain-containing protein [Parvularculaceae bacterium]|nr:DUF177 domain-containing protein [Parvularculaceae bacterium]
MTDGPEKRGAISRVIEIGALHAREAEFVIEANEEQRAAIAARLGAPSITRLRGVFRVQPTRGGAEIDLKLSAAVMRHCVVSLEEMIETVEEEIPMVFDRRFIELDDEGDNEDEWREPLEGDEIDLGELLVQHLSLALDPYPRLEGAESLLPEYRTATLSSPFAALKDLKKTDG